MLEVSKRADNFVGCSLRRRSRRAPTSIGVNERLLGTAGLRVGTLEGLLGTVGLTVGRLGTAGLAEPTLFIEVKCCSQQVRQTLGVGNPAALVVPGRSLEQAGVPCSLLPPESSALGAGVIACLGCLLALIHEPQSVVAANPKQSRSLTSGPSPHRGMTGRPDWSASLRRLHPRREDRPRQVMLSIPDARSPPLSDPRV